MKRQALIWLMCAACQEPINAVAPLRAALAGDGSCSDNKPITGQLGYQGGPLMIAPVNVYFIWYGNYFGGNGSTQLILHNLVRNLGGTPYFDINSLYHDGDYLHPINHVQLGGDYYDNYSQGKTLSLGDLEDVVRHSLHDPNGLNYDSNGIYVIVPTSDVDVESMCSGLCGGHQHFTDTLVDLKYVIVEDPLRCPDQCLPGCNRSVSPNGNPYADAMASALVHELSEVVTDPDVNAYVNGGSVENADKCAWVYGHTYTTSNGALANVHIGLFDYLLQQNWSNSPGACVTAHAIAPDDLICPDASTGNIYVGFDDKTWFDDFGVSSTPLLSGWCSGSHRLVVGDFDGDGRADLLCNSPTDGENRVAYSQGTSYRNAGTLLSSWCYGSGTRILAADVDGDGRDDLVCNNSDWGYVWVAYSKGSSFSTGGSLLINWCTTASTRLLAGDVNGDGLADLICNNSSDGRNWVAFSTGSGFSTGAPLSSYWCYGSGSRFAVGDVDGNGTTDLVCNYTNGTTFFLYGSGRSLSSSRQVSSSFCAGTNTRFVVLDLSHDGRADLICQNLSNGQISSATSSGWAVTDHGVIQTANWCLGAGTYLRAGNVDGLNVQ